MMEQFKRTQEEEEKKESNCDATGFSEYVAKIESEKKHN